MVFCRKWILFKSGVMDSPSIMGNRGASEWFSQAVFLSRRPEVPFSRVCVRMHSASLVILAKWRRVLAAQYTQGVSSSNNESRVSMSCKIETPGQGRERRSSGIDPGGSHWGNRSPEHFLRLPCSRRVGSTHTTQAVRKVLWDSVFWEGSHLVAMWTEVLWSVIQWKMSSFVTTGVVVFSLCCVWHRCFKSMDVSVLEKRIQEPTFFKDPHKIPLCGWSRGSCSWGMLMRFMIQVLFVPLWNSRMSLISLLY